MPKKIKQSNSKQPLVSVIMPVYNAEKTLKDTLSDIQNQTLKEIEIICINDGSTDDSLQILRQCAKDDERIVIINQKNKGAGETRNVGLKHAKGKYLSFLDSDDSFAPEMLENMYAKAVATDADIVICDYTSVFADGTTKKTTIDEKMLPKNHIFSVKTNPQNFFSLYTSVVWNKLYKKSFIEKNNIRYKNPKIGNDVWFAQIACIAADKIVYLPKSYVRYNLLEDSTISSNRETSWRDMDQTWMDIDQYLIDKGLKDLLAFSFIKKVLAVAIDTHKIREPIRSFWEAEFRNNILPYFNFDQYDKTILEENTAYAEMLNVKNKNNFSDKLKDLYDNDRNQIIPIVIPVDSSSVLYAAALIESIKAHSSKDCFYDIYLIHTASLDSYQNVFEKMHTENVRVSFLPVKQYVPSRKLLKYKSLELKKDYNKYLCMLPTLFYGYEKIIFLSPNCIVQKDLAELKNIDMKDNVLAGVANFDNMNHVEDDLNLIYENYLNADVLLIDLKKWEEFDISSKCLEQLEIKTSYGIQDVLNLASKGKTLPILPSWNTLQPDLIDLQKTNSYPLNPQNLYIINYNRSKPWKKPEEPFMEIWWQYARNSAVYEKILFENLRVLQPTPILIAEKTKKAKPPVLMNIKTLKKEVMKQKKRFYPLVAEWIKEHLLSLFTFGEVATKHAVKASKIAERIYQEAQHGMEKKA